MRLRKNMFLVEKYFRTFTNFNDRMTASVCFSFPFLLVVFQTRRNTMSLPKTATSAAANMVSRTAVSTTATNIQLPKQMIYNNGESVMKKGSGLVRVRKGQTEEQYIEQRDDFWQVGPIIQTHTFVTEFIEKYIEKESGNFNISTENDKIKRENIVHGLEKLFYQREYSRCLKDIELIKSSIDLTQVDLNSKKNKNLKRIINELNFIQSKCIEKIQLQNEHQIKNL